MTESSPARTDRRPPGRLAYAGFGLVATLAGVAAGHLVASFLEPGSSPVLAVGSAVIDATPTPMKEWAIRTFGSADKLILVGSVMAGVLVLAAIAGVLTRRRFAVGAAMLVVLTAFPAVAALTRAGSTPLDVLPSVVAAVVGVAALRALDLVATRGSLRRRDDAATGEGGEAGEAPATRGASRRGVLVGSGVMLALAAVMGGAGRLVTQLRGKVTEVTFPTPASPAPAFPEGIEGRFAQISPLRVANADFYRVDTRLDVPLVDMEGWTLTIDGDVENEMTFTFQDLLDMPLIERDITLTCVSNNVGGPYVGGARWIGVRLTDLLDMAGVGSKADQILSTDFDGMTISTPLDIATDGRDAMIALGMNGEVLPREHGYPARMIVPGLYGFISATKWIERITLTTYAERTSYWTDRDWDTDAPIKPMARIDTPPGLQEIPSGKTVIGGVAWAQFDGGVMKVQVQIDGEGWQDAELGPDVNNVYWRQWYYEWDAAEGGHNISARVVDGNGEVQTDARAEPFPNGASGVQALIVNVGA
ncbi:molybdopterin-dependent oxidoreductase [Nocardioides nanhaiensis]